MNDPNQEVRVILMAEFNVSEAAADEAMRGTICITPPGGGVGSLESIAKSVADKTRAGMVKVTAAGIHGYVDAATAKRLKAAILAAGLQLV